MSPPRLLTHAGVTLSVRGWARRLGITDKALRWRLDREKLPPAQALVPGDLRKQRPRKPKP